MNVSKKYVQFVEYARTVLSTWKVGDGVVWWENIEGKGCVEKWKKYTYFYK